MIGSLRSQCLAALTILVIAGTMTSCGRYGSPVRPPSEVPSAAESPAAATTPPQWAEPSSTLGIEDEENTEVGEN